MNVPVPEVVVLVLVTLGALLWIVALMRARALEWFTGPSRLPPWVPLVSEFVVFALSVCAGSVIAIEAAIWLFKIDRSIEPLPARTALLTSYAMQMAWLGVAVGFRALGMLGEPRGETRAVPAAVAGLGAFLLAMPAVALVQKIWEWLLHVLGVSAPPQTAIEFLRQADTISELLPWIVLVGVLVPVAEELLFRQVLYRFLAARVSDPVAMVLSSALFGLMHDNAHSIFPLTVLGVALCLAYRYTGSLITPVVMHACFNLTMLMLVKIGG